MSAHHPFGIAKLEAWPVVLPLHAPFVVATGAMQAAHNIFVRITLESGAYGYGEMAPFPDISGDDQGGALQAFPAVAKECLGHSALHFRKLSHSLQEAAFLAPAVRCGIETALLDALCRGMNIPLWGLWGGRDVRPQDTDMTLPIGPIDQVVRTARDWHVRGFRLFKMKIGHAVDEDIRRVEAVYAACPDTAFILDANQGFSYDQAYACMLAMERLHIPVKLFEQPVGRADVEGLVALRRRGTIAIAADESVRSLEEAKNLIQRNAVDVLNLKIMKCGVMESLDIACLARASGIRLMIGGMVESRVAMGCSWSMVLGLGGFEFLDLDMPLWLAGDPVQGGYTYEGPVMQPWETPGLGLEMKQAPASVIVVE